MGGGGMVVAAGEGPAALDAENADRTYQRRYRSAADASFPTTARTTGHGSIGDVGTMVLLVVFLAGSATARRVALRSR